MTTGNISALLPTATRARWGHTGFNSLAMSTALREEGRGSAHAKHRLSRIGELEKEAVRISGTGRMKYSVSALFTPRTSTSRVMWPYEIDLLVPCTFKAL